METTSNPLVTSSGMFTWVIGMPNETLDLSVQDFEDRVARDCWQASNAAKQWREAELGKRKAETDAAQ